MLKYLFNVAVVAVEGGDSERLLTRMMNAGVTPGHVVPSPTGIILTLPARQYKKIRTLRKGTGCRVYVIRKGGPYFRFLRLYRRRSAVLAILIFLLTVQFLSGLVWRIDTSSMSYTDGAHIKSLLYAEGIYPGVVADSEHLRSAEQQIMLNSTEYSYIKLNFQNGRLAVEMSPLTPYEDVGKTDLSLVASFDGIIHSLRVYEGNSLVKENQSVAKGETLVSNLRLTYDNEIVLTKVYADIIGYGEITYSYAQPQNYSAELLTGESKTLYAANFMSFRLPFYYDARYDENSRRYTVIEPLSFLGFKLPVTIEKTRLYETVSSEVTLTYEEAVQHGETKIHEQFLNDFKEPEVLQRLVSTTTQDDLVITTVEYRFLANIVDG